MTTVLPLMLLLASPALGGETLSAIRIDAGSEQDERRLSRYVTLHAGDVLDPAEVRRSVRHLFATGEFADVIVERRRTDLGLEIVFRPVPAPRLASIAVTGDPILTPGHLRRVTRLRDGETLGPRRLDRAAQDAALELANAGYLEARVFVSTSGAPAASKAVFRIEGGPLTRIASVNVTGVEAIAAQSAARRLQSQPGRPFSRRQAEADGSALRQRLREAGYWSASADVREVYDPLHSHMALAFEAHAGPKTELTFRGFLPSERLRRTARHRLVESGLRPDSLEEICELFEDELRRLGYAFASVSHEQEEQADWRRVVVVAQAGPLVRVASVRIEGADGEALGRFVTTQVGEPYRERQIERDAEAIKRALEERGFASAQVDFDASAREALTPVVLRVHTGARMTLTSIDVATPITLAGATPRDLSIKAGGPYRLSEVARARSALVAVYNNAGYQQATVTVETTPNKAGGTALTFRVDPGSRAYVERVLVAGLQHTHEEVVRRELLVREGEPLSWERVLESHRRLSALGVFRGVSVYELDPDELEHRSLVFAVEEGQRTTLTGGLGAAGVNGELTASSPVNPTLRASLELTRRNLGGLDRDISLFTRFSFRGSRLLATYHQPYLLGHKAEISATVFREEEERTSFNYDRVGATLQSTRTLTPQSTLILRYVFSRTRSNLTVSVSPEETEQQKQELIDRQYQDELSSGPSFSFVNDTRDDPLDPHRGRFFSLDTQLSLAALGGNSFSKSFLQAAGFQRLSGPLLLAVGVRAGAAWTFRSETLDAPDKFYAGGNYSMRGFDTDAVKPDGGNALLVGSLELRYGLTRSLSFAAFTDVGNVFDTVADTTLRKLRGSVGVGLRYRTPVGPIRLDWAFNLDPSGRPPNRLHVTVGHAF